MNQVILFLFNALEIILLVSLGLATLYIFVFAVSGLFYRQPVYKKDPLFRKIAVLIPGYKEDDVIVDVARESLKQDYPTYLFDVIIIADSFQQQTLEHLRQLPIKVVEVKFDKSTKAKALNKAMEVLPDDYQIAVILDADNIMAADFLSKINAGFEDNKLVIQGHRTAKNLDTSFAILDAVSEEINNHIFRKGHRALGLSSAIIGSAMAFRYDFFKELMASVTAVGGFDKEIELKMLKNRVTIEYLDDAYVMDEKIQKAQAFSNQRRRWLSAQFHYVTRDFTSALRHLVLKGNIDYFEKTLQYLQPPRVLILGTMIVLGIVFPVINTLAGAAIWMSWAWILAGITCIVAFLLCIPGIFYNWQTLKALFSLPKGMMLMILSLFRLKGANKQFIHTKHGAVKTVRNIQ
ncbi:MAG: glycosyltransferase [Bacteroidetes bacterium]|nr:glycosyltransferase [Bacteroidota bacterium]